MKTLMDLKLPLHTPLFIDGSEGTSSGGGTLLRENPARSAEIVTISQEGSVADAHAAIAAARYAFDHNIKGWVTDARQREQVLRRTAQLVREEAQRLAQMVSLEVGMPIRQAGPHVMATADIFDFYAGYATKLYGEAMSLANGSFINLLREPVGVVGMILPWNFPLTQAARKIAPALAVGCTAVVKPSGYTSASTYALVQLLHRAGAPDGVLNLVSGHGGTVGQALVDHPHIDKLSFTGSTDNGKRILQRATANLKRVSLELGGKNPCIVFADADLDAAAQGTVFGMFRNAGQACGAVSRLLVQREVRDEFLSRLVDVMRRLRVGAPGDAGTDMGPVISRSQEQSILGYIEEAKQQGFRLLAGGGKLESPEHNGGYFIAPTLFDDVTPESRLAREEVFGPVLAAMPFSDEDEAVRLANDSPFGLTASVWTQSQARSLRVARRIQAGTVWLNDAYTQPVEGIWGGYKQSGLGRELGPYGVEDFVEIKQIYIDGTGATHKAHYAQVIAQPSKAA